MKMCELSKVEMSKDQVDHKPSILQLLLYMLLLFVGK